jgi:hypothetical protein
MQLSIPKIMVIKLMKKSFCRTGGMKFLWENHLESWFGGLLLTDLSLAGYVRPDHSQK